MTLVVRLESSYDINNNFEFCKSLINNLKKFIESCELNLYKDYPNVSQGQLLDTVEFNKIPTINIITVVKSISREVNINDVIFQFDFKLKNKDLIYDGYLRLNNFILSKIFGNIELDIFPRDSIINLGELIFQEKTDELKLIIEEWIKKRLKIFL